MFSQLKALLSTTADRNTAERITGTANHDKKFALDVNNRTHFLDEVVLDNITGVRPFTKFGYRTGLTAANGEETIWAASGNFTPMTAASTFTIAYNSSNDGAGTTGARYLYFDYVDENGIAKQDTHIMGSTGSDITSFRGLGINRIAVALSGTNQTNVSDIAVTETAGGTTQAIVPAGNGVTQQCIFHTAADSYAIAKYLTFNVNKLSGSSPKVTVKGYVYNRNVNTKFEIYRHIIDTQSENTVTIAEPVGFRLTPTDVLYFIADTDTNNTVITLRFSLLEYQSV